jgi:hypothetical protein
MIRARPGNLVLEDKESNDGWLQTDVTMSRILLISVASHPLRSGSHGVPSICVYMSLPQLDADASRPKLTR